MAITRLSPLIEALLEEWVRKSEGSLEAGVGRKQDRRHLEDQVVVVSKEQHLGALQYHGQLLADGAPVPYGSVP